MSLGLSEERLADALGVTAGRLMEWESGARRVGAEQLHLVSEILDAPPEEFFENVASDAAPPLSFVQRSGRWFDSPTPTAEECVRLVRAFRVITDAEARDAILALVLALSPDETPRN